MHEEIKAPCVGVAGTPAAAVADAGPLDADVVRTVDDAVATFHAHRYDVVVTGEALPDGSGLSLVDLLGDACPIVFCPEQGDESLAGRAVAVGADAYVPATEAPSTLVPRIRDVATDTQRSVTDQSGTASATSNKHSTTRTASEQAPTRTANEHTPGRERPRSHRSDPVRQRSLLFEQAPFPVVEWTPDPEVARWNPAAEALFGYDESAAVGRRPTELIATETEREAVRSGLQSLLNGETEQLRGITENITADGEWVVCEWYSVPRRDEHGQIVGVLSFARDITQQQQRADRLDALHGSARALFECTDESTVATHAVDAAVDIIGAPGAVLFQPSDGELQTAAAAGGVDDGWWPNDITAIARTAQDSEQPEYISHTGRSEGHVGAASVVCYSLDGHGVLVLGAPAPDAFSEIDRNLGQVLAAATAAALGQAENQRSLRRSRAIVEAIGDGVYVLDDDGTIIAANSVLAELTGYEQEELEGTHSSTLLGESDIERGNEIIRSILSDEDTTVGTETFDMHTAGDEIIPCEVTMSVLEQEGSFTGTVGIVRDITDRKEMEAHLRERKRRIESLYDATTRLERCRETEDVCAAAVEAATELFAVDCCSLALKDDDSWFVCSVDETETVTTGRGPIGGTAAEQADEAGETTIVNGSVKTLSGNTPSTALASPVGNYGVLELATDRRSFDEDDKELVELLLAHVTEALDRIAYESELRSERDRLAALFGNVPDSVVMTSYRDGQPVVLNVNDAFEDVFGYDGAAIVGDSLDEFIVPEDCENEADTIGEHAADGEIIETEVERKTATGRRDFLLRVVPLEVDPTVTYAVYTDITDRKQQQNRVEVLNRVLRHDLRNGMNIIKGSAEVIGDRADGDDIEPHARTIQQRSDELLALAEKTREIEEALDRDKRSITPRDVVEPAKKAIAEVHAEFPDAAIEFAFPDTAQAKADEMVGRALYHLIHNAVDHSDERIPSVDVSIERKARYVEIQIADNGPGIPDAEYELISEQREITQLRHASGLGLWVANWAVTHSGGSISFEDNQPKGTVATIRLPVPSADGSGVEIESGSI